MNPGTSMPQQENEMKKDDFFQVLFTRIKF